MPTLLLLLCVSLLLAGEPAGAGAVQDPSTWSDEQLRNFTTQCEVHTTVVLSLRDPKDPKFSSYLHEYTSHLFGTAEMEAFKVANPYDSVTGGYGGKDRSTVVAQLAVVIAGVLKRDAEANRLHERVRLIVQRHREAIVAACMRDAAYAEAVRTAKERGWSIMPTYSPIILWGEDVAFLGSYRR